MSTSTDSLTGYYRRVILRELILNGGAMPPIPDEHMSELALAVESLVRDGLVHADDARWCLAPGALTTDLDTLTAIRLLMEALECSRSPVPDDHAPLVKALGEDAGKVYRAARDALIRAGVVAVEQGHLSDRSLVAYRSPTRPAWTPQWTVKPTAPKVKAAPAPAPTSAPAPAPTPKAPAPVPTVAAKVPTPATPTAPTPVKQTPTIDMSALDRIAELLSIAVSDGRLERSVQHVEDAARDDLARRICVMIGADGPLRRGEITGGRLSKGQRSRAPAALSYALGQGALSVSGTRFVLGDPTRIGWTREGFTQAVEQQVDKRRRESAKRAAAAANASIEASRDCVTGRAS